MPYKKHGNPCRQQVPPAAGVLLQKRKPGPPLSKKQPQIPLITATYLPRFYKKTAAHPEARAPPTLLLVPNFPQRRLHIPRFRHNSIKNIISWFLLSHFYNGVKPGPGIKVHFPQPSPSQRCIPP